ncbi:hypothetical protein IJU97_00220 [bacterium]|nr:hypothetical protein [bacterium]
MPNNRKMQAFQKQFKKSFHKFTNYTKNQKAFTIFLLVFAVVLVLCPIAKVSSMELNSTSSEFFWFIGSTYVESMVVVFASMLFLL